MCLISGLYKIIFHFPYLHIVEPNILSNSLGKVVLQTAQLIPFHGSQLQLEKAGELKCI